MGFFNLLDTGGGGSTTLISTPIYVELESGMKNIALNTGGFKENKLLYSSTFDNATWVTSAGGGTLVTANAVANPLDGTIDADKVYENNSAGIAHVFYQPTIAGFTSGTTYRFSIYAKYAGRKYFAFRLSTGAISPNANIDVDIQAGTIRSSSGCLTTAISSSGNGWYCISGTVAASSTSTSQMNINFRNDADASTYNGDGSSGIYVYMAQVSEISATPAIVTTTSAAVKTLLDDFTIQVIET